MSILSNLASGIHAQEFDSDDTITTTGAITAWMETNLGQLNALLYTEFSGAAAPLDLEAQGIYRELYLAHFYRKESRKALRGIVDTGIANGILSLTDGDSTVAFVNKNEVAKVFRLQAKDHQENLDKMVAQYQIWEAAPRQVGGIEASTGSGSY